NPWRLSPAVVAEVLGGSAGAEALARLAISLQQRAGARVSWWTVVEGSEPESRVIALEFEDERVGTRSVRLAHALLRDGAGASSEDVAKAVTELRALNDREHGGPTAA